VQVGLHALRGAGAVEVRRALVLRLAALARDPDAARRIVAGPAIRVLTSAVLPRPHAAAEAGSAGGGREGAGESEGEGEGEGELRSDALVGLASLWAPAHPRARDPPPAAAPAAPTQRPARGAPTAWAHPGRAFPTCGWSFCASTSRTPCRPLPPPRARATVALPPPRARRADLPHAQVIPALVGAGGPSAAAVGNGSTGTAAPLLAEPQRNALSIVRALARDAVASCTLRLQRTSPLAAPPPAASPRGAAPAPVSAPAPAPAPLADGEELPAVVATGHWAAPLRGTLVALPPSALVPGTLVCGVGDVVLLTAPQTSREVQPPSPPLV
jgi:hypothetical protein